MSLIFLGTVIVKPEKSTKNRVPELGKMYPLPEESGTTIIWNLVNFQK